MKKAKKTTLKKSGDKPRATKRVTSDEAREARFKAQIALLKQELADTREVLRAIQAGEVDALVVSREEGQQVFTLQGAEHPYRVVIETMNEGTATLSNDGTVLYCNNRFAEILKTPMETIVGGHLYSFLSERDLAEFRRMLRKSRQEVARSELVFHAASGEEVPVLASMAILKDTVKGICMVVTDIGELKAAQKALEKVNTTLEQRVAERTEALRKSEERLQTRNTDLQAAAEELQATNEELLTSNEELRAAQAAMQESEKRLQVSNENFIIANEELHRLNRTLRAMSNSSRMMVHWQEDEQAYLDAVCRIIVEDCGHKMVWIGYAEDNKAKSIKPAASAGFEEGYLETLKLTWADTERGHGPTGTAIRTGKVSMCENMLTDPKFEPWRKEAIKRGYASSIVLPLKNVYKTFGALTIYSKEPDPFTKDEIKLLTNLANDLANGITTLRLRVAHAKSEEALHQSEEQYRELVENANSIIVKVDTKGNFTYWNEYAEKFFGYTKEEVLGKNVLGIITPKTESTGRDLVKSLDNIYKDPDKFSLHVNENIKRNGERVWIAWSNKAMFDKDGKRIGHMAIGTDITERKRAEEKLRQSKEQLRLFVEHAPAAIAMLDKEMRYVAASRRWLADYGLTGQQVEGRSHYEIFTEIPERWKEIHRRCLGGAVERADEDPFERANGTTQWIRWEVRPWYSEPDTIGGIIIFSEDVTESRRVREELRENREELDLALLSAGMGAWHWDISLNRRYFDDHVCHLLGINPQKFTGTAEEFFAVVHPDDKDRIKTALTRTIEENVPYESEYRVTWPDGSIHHIATFGRLTKNGEGRPAKINGIIWDVTERKRIEDALANERANLQTIFDAVDVGMLLVDEGGEVKRVNNAVARWISKDPSAVFRGQPGDILGCIHALESPEGCGRGEECCKCPIRNAFQSALQSGHPIHDVEAEAILAMGENEVRLWLEASADLLILDGKRHVILTLNNINARKEAEALLRESELRERQRAEELERLSDELEHKNEELESIIRIASHDLGSPLMNIRGFSGELAKDIGKLEETLKKVELPQEVNEKAAKVFGKYVPEAIGFIQTSADSISRMIKSLMAVAKAGTVPVHITDVDMDALAAKVAGNAQLKLKEGGGELTVEPLPQCRGDADQLAQVFTNLVENAIKYREPSRPLKIQIYGSTDADKAIYCVEDNGKGIAEEHLDKVFNLFTRLHPEAAKGEGIGLTIVKRMVERQGGKIWVNSEVNKGSKFFLSLPK